MLKKRLALLGLALLLIAPIALADTPEEMFFQELNQQISSGNVQQGGATAPYELPPGLQAYPGITGITYWPNGDSAPYTWVYAQAKDNPNIKAWGHTTWSPCAPHRNHIYLHNQSMHWPIQPNHAYYIKGLHWIPKNTPDQPSQNPPALPFPPPNWAQGMVLSPTCSTKVWNGTDLLRCDVCLSGNPQMW